MRMFWGYQIRILLSSVEFSLICHLNFKSLLLKNYFNMFDWSWTGFDVIYGINKEGEETYRMKIILFDGSINGFFDVAYNRNKEGEGIEVKPLILGLIWSNWKFRDEIETGEYLGRNK